MACHSRVLCRRALLAILWLISTAAVLSVVARAQDDLDQIPKYEIFVGYQWLHPGATVPAPGFSFANPASQVLSDMPWGAVGSFTYSFYKNLGLEAEFGHSMDDNVTETTTSLGPHLTFRYQRFKPFLHALPGWNHLEAPGLSSRDGFGAVLGGGFVLQATRKFGIRLGADYVYARQHFDDIVPPQFPDLRRVMMNGVRASAGPVFDFGYPRPAAPTVSLSTQPSEVMAGEPVTATATPNNFNPKHTLKYEWGSTGGKISGTADTATIDTTGIASGKYTVTVRVSDPKMKAGGVVLSTANFTVKEPPKHAPTMSSCTANPATLQAGGSSTITCDCTSPDGVPVNVDNWTSSAGSISGSGNTATLNTTGVPPATIIVSATCTDSRGLASRAVTTQVTVENPPPPPPAPQARKLSGCDFANMAKIGKPWRVDNECKGILDDVAKNLQQNTDNKLVIVGNMAPTEKRANLAAERAVNAKAYLTGGEAKLGIDPSRIESRAGSAGTQTIEFWIVPGGATFSGEGTQPVDESKVKAIPDHPRPAVKSKSGAPPKS